MKKIKSRIDVITNSSTEVFTLKTTKSLQEVSEILRSITSGYQEPEIMEKGKGVLGELQEYGYLFDPDDPESMAEFYIGAFGCTGWMDENWERHDYPGAKELQEAWKEYIWTKKDEILKYWRNQGWTYFKPDQLKYECFSSYHLPDPVRYVDEFLGSYRGPRPEILILKDSVNVNSYIGKIGFMGIDDNSIPYETWDEINEKLDGTNWHMG